MRASEKYLTSTKRLQNKTMHRWSAFLYDHVAETGPFFDTILVFRLLEMYCLVWAKFCLALGVYGSSWFFPHLVFIFSERWSQFCQLNFVAKTQKYTQEVVKLLELSGGILGGFKLNQIWIKVGLSLTQINDDRFEINSVWLNCATPPQKKRLCNNDCSRKI